MGTFVYPTNVELNTIAQEKMPMLTGDDPLFDILPIREVNAAEVRWEQKDNYLGLQQIRGIGGEPAKVNRIGHKVYRQEPGVYGEFEVIDEIELTRRRPMGEWTGGVSVDDLVMECQDHLLNRRLDRMRVIGWTLLATGTFSVSLPYGANSPVAHTATYTTQTHSASDWNTPSTSTPLLDFRNVQLLGRGKGVSFGAGSRAYMNRTTFNLLMANTNAADLSGSYTAELSTVRSQGSINRILQSQGLPEIVIYDEGYLADPSGTFTLFIPNDKVIIVGQRPVGQRLGEFQVVRNANNPGMAPGFYQKIVDSAEHSNPVPRKIEVHDGGNYGPAIFFPSAIVIMSV